MSSILLYCDRHTPKTQTTSNSDRMEKQMTLLARLRGECRLTSRVHQYGLPPRRRTAVRSLNPTDSETAVASSRQLTWNRGKRALCKTELPATSRLPFEGPGAFSEHGSRQRAFCPYLCTAPLAAPAVTASAADCNSLESASRKTCCHSV